MTKSFRIVLADDHPAIREALASHIDTHLKNQMVVVAQAADGLEAIAAVEKHKPDLLLVDIQMPRLDGVAAIRSLRQQHPDLRIIVFSMFEDQAHVIDAIRAGADDYLFKKNAASPQVARHLLQALEGTSPPQDLLRSRLFQAVRGAEPSSFDTGFSPLTGAELEILKRVAHHGLTMKEVAQEIGGKAGTLSENTVRKHLEHIYQKLGARDKAHAVCLAIKNGLISAEDAQPAEK